MKLLLWKGSCINMKQELYRVQFAAWYFLTVVVCQRYTFCMDQYGRRGENAAPPLGADFRKTS